MNASVEVRRMQPHPTAALESPVILRLLLDLLGW